MSGYIFLHRKLMNNPIWKDKPFCKSAAWIDLLMRANWKQSKILIGNTDISVERGEILNSIMELGNAWGWSRKKVSSFLDYLEKGNMVGQKRNNKFTLITICNYDTYNDVNLLIEHQKNINGTSTAHQKNIKRTHLII